MILRVEWDGGGGIEMKGYYCIWRVGVNVGGNVCN